MNIFLRFLWIGYSKLERAFVSYPQCKRIEMALNCIKWMFYEEVATDNLAAYPNCLVPKTIALRLNKQYVPISCIINSHVKLNIA